jgi:hypothetical protein
VWAHIFNENLVQGLNCNFTGYFSTPYFKP